MLRTLSVPLVQTPSSTLPTILHMPDLVERSTSDCKHLNWSSMIRLRTIPSVTNGDHDSIGNQSFKWDTHRFAVAAVAESL